MEAFSQTGSASAHVYDGVMRSHADAINEHQRYGWVGLVPGHLFGTFPHVDLVPVPRRRSLLDGESGLPLSDEAPSQVRDAGEAHLVKVCGCQARLIAFVADEDRVSP
jgi:hypothetical protein